MLRSVKRKIVVYVYQIDVVKYGSTFPTEMLRELISPTAESTQVTRLVDPLNEHDSETASSLNQNTDSITGPTPQSLSCVKRISIYETERQDIKILLKNPQSQKKKKKRKSPLHYPHCWTKGNSQLNFVPF